MSVDTLLIEIGCEDLPARYQRPLAETLRDTLAQGLDDEGVSRGSARAYATPRRIAVCIEAVAHAQQDRAIERTGPALSVALRDGQPSPAGLGFAKSCGVEFDALERTQTDKGEYLLYRATQPGQSTLDLLPELFARALKQMDRQVPKRMRWGAGDATFVRPVQWLCAMHGEDIVPLTAFGLAAGADTYGHRFHAPAELRLDRADHYVERLREAKVWADIDSRQAEIAQQVRAAGEALDGAARIDADLLAEVTDLVEWPQAVAGRFESRFLQVPAEAIVLTIQDNQRYFPVFDAQGQLLPAFVTVANIVSRDEAQVVAGNERVVRPRLEDALFFWQQDGKRPLAERLDELQRVTWAKGLGSLRDKALRLEALSGTLAPHFGADAAVAAQAGRLAKCDLVTLMVFEMPELQGIMGGHYLRAEGADEAVADAVSSHYRPAGPEDALPESPAGRAVAAADKLDTLAGYYSIDAIPTASKDPYGLRRAALRVQRAGGAVAHRGHALRGQAGLGQQAAQSLLQKDLQGLRLLGAQCEVRRVQQRLPAGRRFTRQQQAQQAQRRRPAGHAAPRRGRGRLHAHAGRRCAGRQLQAGAQHPARRPGRGGRRDRPRALRSPGRGCTASGPAAGRMAGGAGRGRLRRRAGPARRAAGAHRRLFRRCHGQRRGCRRAGQPAGTTCGLRCRLQPGRRLRGAGQRRLNGGGSLAGTGVSRTATESTGRRGARAAGVGVNPRWRGCRAPSLRGPGRSGARARHTAPGAPAGGPRAPAHSSHRARQRIRPAIRNRIRR